MKKSAGLFNEEYDISSLKDIRSITKYFVKD